MKNKCSDLVTPDSLSANAQNSIERLVHEDGTVHEWGTNTNKCFRGEDRQFEGRVQETTDVKLTKLFLFFFFKLEAQPLFDPFTFMTSSRWDNESQRDPLGHSVAQTQVPPSQIFHIVAYLFVYASPQVCCSLS